MRRILERPEVYHAYQTLGGFHDARRRALAEYVDISKVDRVFDIGCGPGHTVNYIPPDIDYVGFDTERRYIAYANRHFSNRGSSTASSSSAPTPPSTPSRPCSATSSCGRWRRSSAREPARHTADLPSARRDDPRPCLLLPSPGAEEGAGGSDRRARPPRLLGGHPRRPAE